MVDEAHAREVVETVLVDGLRDLDVGDGCGVVAQQMDVRVDDADVLVRSLGGYCEEKDV